MARKVLCPHCGLSSEYESEEETHCGFCLRDFTIDSHDFQNVRFIESNDGYHSWYSQPTAYHMIYECLSYPDKCDECIHFGGTFCRNGRIDKRLERSTCIGDTPLSGMK
ncbi:MAG: hypothetical protein VB078_07900 [Clostridiaceae bacterium]|nr:hypothetical protein [Clostridiaceae bacterium]